MQQVNLYLPEFRPQRLPLRASQMLWLALLWLLVLCAVSVFSARHNHSQHQQRVQEQAELDQLRTQVLALSAQTAAGTRATLDSEMTRVQAQIQQRQRILALLAQQNLGNAEGFSGHLQAMARQSLDTLQLQQFSLQAGGSYAELFGRARQANQVPLYLQRLRTESSFEQVRFGVLHLEQEASGLRFSVQRQLPEGRP